MAVVFEKPKALTDAPFHYCPGCPHGIIHRLVAEVIDELSIEGKGFSLVEVVSACPTNWGMTPQKALEWVESDMLPYYPIGVYKDRTAAKEEAAK